MDYRELSQQIDLYTGGMSASPHICDHSSDSNMFEQVCAMLRYIKKARLDWFLASRVMVGEIFYFSRALCYPLIVWTETWTRWWTYGEIFSMGKKNFSVRLSYLYFSVYHLEVANDSFVTHSVVWKRDTLIAHVFDIKNTS